MNSIPRKVGESGLNASAGHTRILGCTWYTIEIRELFKSVNLMGEILARLVLRNNHLRKPHDK